MERVRNALEDGERAEFETFSSTYERWFSLNIYPISDGVAVLFQDTSEQKRGEEERRRLVAIVDSSEDAIISKNLQRDHHVLERSGPAPLRIRSGGDRRKADRDPDAARTPEDMTLILDRIRRGERVEHFETVRVTKHGDHIPVSLSVSAIKDASGRVIGAAKIARDITERKHAEAELERLLRRGAEGGADPGHVHLRRRP